MFYRLARLLELYDGLRMPVRIDNRELLLIHEDGQTWLVERRCPHAGTPLERGQVRQAQIRCPGHGLVFSLNTGRCVAGGYALQTYPVAYDGQWVGVEL